jgi:hypothetical protein
MTNATTATPSPQEQMARRLSAVRSKLETLQGGVHLSNVRDSIEDLDTRVQGLRPSIQELRNRGYVFGKGMESRSASINTQWRTVRQNALQQIDRQTPELENALKPLSSQFSQIQHRSNNPAAIQSVVDRLEKDLGTFESKVRAVENSIRGMYDSFSSDVNQFKTQIDQIRWSLQQLAEASFQLRPTEGLVMAVKAVYSRDEKMDKDDPKGILFLTDQRLLFEQKQEVATKKILFVTTEKKKVQNLVMEAIVGQVDQILANKKGIFGHQDHLSLTFTPGASLSAAWFHLDGQDCSIWQGLIGQARSRGFDGERAVAVDKQAEEKVRSAPSHCPGCGAPVTQAVLRGMDSLQCEYCNCVMRL